VDLANPNLLYGGSGKLFGKSPNIEEARNRAKEILKELHKMDPAHLFTVTHVDLNFIKGKEGDQLIDEKDWGYGNVQISQVSLPIWANITCRNQRNQELYYPGILSDTTYDLNSFFSEMLVSVFFSTSIRHKLDMIIKANANTLPATEWGILYNTKFSLEIKDLFYLGLYADIKTDVIIKDSSFTSLDNLITVLHSNLELYCVPCVASVLIYAVDRLKNHLGFFGKTDKFEEFTQKLHQILKTNMNQVDYAKTVEEAKKVYEWHLNHKDLKDAFGHIMDHNLQNHFAANHKK